MKVITSTFAAALFAATAVVVQGQNTTCVAQDAFTECLKNQNNLITACGPTDAACLCREKNQLVFCYINFCSSSADFPAVTCARNTACAQTGGANVNATNAVGWKGDCATVNGNAGNAGSGGNGTVVTGNGTVVPNNGTNGNGNTTGRGVGGDVCLDLSGELARKWESVEIDSGDIPFVYYVDLPLDLRRRLLYMHLVPVFGNRHTACRFG
ncbi:uncharacterized protein EV422DRAFT_170660 [Fimicolochytrium jonesii]|uniref:uncharacterized protein n=1 Tax=Fimicolochytrium jonesii TaxID=1396493 RepID=UPI0022FE0CBA|nr:uncharacterized protein EV422DRAFT_170660 [Fimicolochytrium jonesii]KAI8818525.1 hypothetical protein EV422DRAFT_170660 [Fimicolochytrium jonesii]